MSVFKKLWFWWNQRIAKLRVPDALGGVHEDKPAGQCFVAMWQPSYWTRLAFVCVVAPSVDEALVRLARGVEKELSLPTNTVDVDEWMKMFTTAARLNHGPRLARRFKDGGPSFTAWITVVESAQERNPD